MKLFLLGVILSISLLSCAQSNNKEIKPGITTKPSSKESVATFSEGCFWHAEAVFQSLVGVRDAVSGYASGITKDPTYEEVGSGNTGYAETVQVYYDSSKISFETLVKAFFASQDPTQVNGQGNDIGTQYRSIAFYRNNKEKEIIENQIKTINISKKYSNKIATQVIPFSKFYTAEDYHQEYMKNHPENPYVQNVCMPEFQKFKKEFKGNFKP